MEIKEQTAGKRPINPFVDWGFKYVFGRDENKDLMIGFLNLLLEPESAIRDIRYLNTELLGDSPELRRCVVDVIATMRWETAIWLRCRTLLTSRFVSAWCIMPAA
jgi:hypothetical protein